MGRYQQYYNIDRKTPIRNEAEADRSKLNDRIIYPHTFKERFEDSKTLQLPPTRYTIRGNDLADIVQRQTGAKGPYDCFTGFLLYRKSIQLNYMLCVQYLEIHPLLSDMQLDPSSRDPELCFTIYLVKSNDLIIPGTIFE